MNNSGFWTGVLCAAASAASFGLIPLFAVPLMRGGLSPQAAALFRFGLAALFLPPLLYLMKASLKISARRAGWLALLALFYFLDVQLFFLAFQYLASGLAAALEFMAPVFVLLIMVLFFHQKFQWRGALAALLALGGVCLMGGGSESSLSGITGGGFFTGVVLALLSAIFLAFYMIGCGMGGINELNPMVSTFYLMLFGSIYCGAFVLASGGFSLPQGPGGITRCVLLALVTAVFSNWTLILAVKRVGPLLASILGALEPLTALFIGAAVFNESLDFWALGGAFLVICGAALAVVGENKKGPERGSGPGGK